MAEQFFKGADMIVTCLVLGAVLLSLLGLIAAFFQRRRVMSLDENAISTAAQLDAAMATQRSIRTAELQRRMTDRNYWSYGLLGLALLMQMAALAADHFAHPSIAVTNILPLFVIVLTARAARRREAQRQLDAHVR